MRDHILMLLIIPPLVGPLISTTNTTTILHTERYMWVNSRSDIPLAVTVSKDFNQGIDINVIVV